MALFKVFRGKSSKLNEMSKTDGYAYFCTDDGSFWIDYVDEDGNLQRKQVNESYLQELGYKIDNLPQADWENKNPFDKGFIKNKPFYYMTSLEIANGTYVSQSNEYYGGAYCITVNYPDNQILDIPTEVGVEFDNISYSHLTVTETPMGSVAGNLSKINSFAGTTYEDTGEPFVIGFAPNTWLLLSDPTQQTTHRIEIYFNLSEEERLKKLDPMFLPEGVAYTSDLDGYVKTGEYANNPHTDFEIISADQINTNALYFDSTSIMVDRIMYHDWDAEQSAKLYWPAAADAGVIATQEWVNAQNFGGDIDTSNLVDITSDQTIEGVKVFEQPIFMGNEGGTGLYFYNLYITDGSVSTDYGINYIETDKVTFNLPDESGDSEHVQRTIATREWVNANIGGTTSTIDQEFFNSLY